VNLAPFFMEGADGIKSMIARLKKLGFVLSDEDAKKAEELNDAIGRMLTSSRLSACRSVGAGSGYHKPSNKIAAATTAIKAFVAEHQKS
jgi:hypothetical protein